MDNESLGPARSKSISQLHFNAINNAAATIAAKPAPKYSGSSTGSSPEEQKLLLPGQSSQRQQFIIMPAASINRSASGAAHHQQQQHQQQQQYYPLHSAYGNGSGMVSGQSSLAPSTHTSPMGSPTTSRPRHLSSMRSLRSGQTHLVSQPSSGSSAAAAAAAAASSVDRTAGGNSAHSSPVATVETAQSLSPTPSTSTASTAQLHQHHLHQHQQQHQHHHPQQHQQQHQLHQHGSFASNGSNGSSHHSGHLNNNNHHHQQPLHHQHHQQHHQSQSQSHPQPQSQHHHMHRSIPRNGSYVFSDCGSTKIYSDAASLRSIASIGMGSTDGKKMVIRRVPTSPTELLTIINQPGPHDANADDESFDGMSEDSETAHLKPRRQHWASKMQFVLACIGYSVGLGNVWRFPYLCYKSGGGVFLIPYLIILVICGIPMLFMELAVGQYTGRGPIGALGQLCPLFKGAGLASVVISFLMSTYYSVIIAYAIYYFFTSFRPAMPWVDCSGRWSTPDCWTPSQQEANMTRPIDSRPPSEEFFENKVLQISNGIEYPGGMRWELVACLVCAWILVYFAIWKSIKSSAKVRYFTATLPFVLIVVFLGRALTLDGAELGLRYFFKPNWALLANSNVWINAAAQNFNSLGIAFGSMISFASYNKYNNNFLHDVLAVSFVNAITSVLVGIFAFATLGNIAWEQGTSVDAVISDGPGFIFVVYPQAMAKMPASQMWAVMFFFMLLCLGLNSQFAIVEVVVTSIQDGFPDWIRNKLVYHELLVLIVCVVAFFFGLPNLIQGGIYYFQLIDHYAASISIMFLAFFQIIAIAWFYGVGRLSKNIKQMTGKSPSLYFRSCWLVVGPFLLIGLFIFSLINYEQLTYHNGQYEYPTWAHALGWSIMGTVLICIPIYGFVTIMRADGETFFERLKSSIKPNIYECRICGEHHCEHEFPADDQLSIQEMTPIMTTVPSSLDQQQQQQQLQYQQQLLQQQQYTMPVAQPATQRPPRPQVQAKLFLQDPPAGHPHKNGGNGAAAATNGTSAKAMATTEEMTEAEDRLHDQDQLAETSDENNEQPPPTTTKS